MNKYLLFLLMLTSANAFAAVSKWVDADGQVHYSDQPPPPNAKSKTMRQMTETEGPAGGSGVAAPKTLAEKEAELKKAEKQKKESSDKAAKEQEKTDAIKANCANAQQNLKSLQSGVRMVKVGPDGEQVYIDDQEREQRMAKVQKDIGTYCK